MGSVYYTKLGTPYFRDLPHPWDYALRGPNPWTWPHRLQWLNAWALVV